MARVPRLIRSEQAEAGAATPLPADRRIALLADQQAAFTLEDYAALRIRGPAQILLLPEAEPALLIGHGLAVLDIAQRSRRVTPSALWLGTPRARIEVAESARLAVRVYEDLSVRVAVITGRVGLALVDAQPISLAAGESGCLLGDDVLEGRERFAKLEAAEHWLAAAPPCARPTPLPAHAQNRASRPLRQVTRGRASPDHGTPATELATARQGALAPDLLAQALSALARESERERSLVAAHQALHPRDAAAAASLRTDVVQLAVSQMRLRARVRSLRAQLESEALAAPPSNARAALLERARRALPYR